jgi:metal-responsive CopG/Arc/MetJ family transcriptional regulator
MAEREITHKSVSLSLSLKLLKRVEDYQFKNRIASRSAAIEEILIDGLGK